MSVHGTVICAQSLEGAGQAEAPRAGHSGRDQNTATEVRETEVVSNSKPYGVAGTFVACGEC